MYRIRNEKGFTVIEVLITSSLLLLLLIPFFGLLHSTVLHYRTTEAGVNHQQNLRIAMEAITKDLRQCKGLVAMASTTKLDEENLLLRTENQETIWYYLSGHDLRWAKKGRADLRFYGHNPVAGSILSLNFSYNKIPLADSTQVTVRLEGQDELGGHYAISSTVLIRVD
jgi:type II secretory pathway component PulJ